LLLPYLRFPFIILIFSTGKMKLLKAL
jgi:hypothetical protein